jgi:hypothetical protein
MSEPRAPMPLTDGTRARIRVLFAPGDHASVERLLVTRCGHDLPLVNDWVQLVERIRYAVLKLSNGDVGALERHVAVARTDWRDVLVAAGFGHDPLAHLAWYPPRTAA